MDDDDGLAGLSLYIGPSPPANQPKRVGPSLAAGTIGSDFEQSLNPKVASI